MPFFRKKPVVIEARQIPAPIGESEDVMIYLELCDDLAKWCGGISFMLASESDPHMIIETMDGDMKASPLDYIIKGVNGEFYPCKPDIFEKTYDVVEVEMPNPFGHF
jgi:hypothetical protein